jgi:hypothetical protein
MKRIILAVICSAFVWCGAEAADVGVSIQFSQPGLYGRVDVGQYPQPQVIVAQPVMAAPPPPAAPPPEPIYLWVPPGHRMHWEKHCREYHACGHPVYFVDHDWYREHVMAQAPQGRGDREDRREHGRGHGHDDDHGQGHGRDKD